MPMSMENGPGLTRLKVTRVASPTFCTAVNTSGAVVDVPPLTSTVSLPFSPLSTSEPSPLFHTRVSSPSPPFNVSPPRNPMTRSVPS